MLTIQNSLPIYRELDITKDFIAEVFLKNKISLHANMLLEWIELWIFWNSVLKT